jgi:hypothetical protein
VINTYGPTATELEKTLDEGMISEKDYFDIALYAYNILRKSEKSPNILTDTLMGDAATYAYFRTFFRASSRYIESISDGEKKQQTIQSFSQQFYSYVLTTIANSLYKYFSVVEDGAIYLSPKYREGIRVKIPEDTAAALASLSESVDYIGTMVEGVSTGSGKIADNTYTQIRDNITRI